MYVVCQLLGSICGAALLLAATSPDIDRTGGLGSNGLQNPNVTIANAFVVEAMGTFLLMFVVLESAVVRQPVSIRRPLGRPIPCCPPRLARSLTQTPTAPIRAPQNTHSVTTNGESAIRGNKQNLAPIPIGLAVFMAHVVCIPVTGCSINPTRSFGPALVSGTWTNHWLWWVGPCCGSTLAALVWGGLKQVETMGPAPKVAVEAASDASVTKVEKFDAE